MNNLKTNNLLNLNYQFTPIDNQFTQIIINSTFELDNFIKNLQIQKNALAATALIVSILLCLLTFLDLNILIFSLGFVVGLTGLSCAISAAVLDSFIRNYNEINKNIYQTYISFLYLLPNSDEQQTSSFFKQIQPLFLNLKSEIEKHINLIGAKEILQQIDKNITSLQKIINDLNSNN